VSLRGPNETSIRKLRPSIQPDCIVSDIRMPVISGLDLAHRLNETNKRNDGVLDSRARRALVGPGQPKSSTAAFPAAIASRALPPPAVTRLAAAIRPDSRRIIDGQAFKY
jgi:CheY-like chemotaxis protein